MRALAASRLVLLALGVLVLTLVWATPLLDLIPGPFSIHMTMHMSVVAIAAPFIAIGLAGGRFDPVPRARWLFAAIPASLVELVVVWGWHAPGLHHFARHSRLGLVLEQGTFIASALVVWLAAFGGSGTGAGNRRGAGVLALLLTSMHMTLLGALLALPPRALYAHGDPSPTFTALEDQHLGGAIMLAVGGVSYLLGGLWLTGALLKERGGLVALGRPKGLPR